MSDACLVVAIARGSEAAFAEVYCRHGDAVYRLAARLCTAEGAAEVTQEVFVSLWRAPEHFDPAKVSLRNYLLVIGHHETIDVVRAETDRSADQQRANALAEEHPRADGPGTEVIERARAARIGTALDRLPPPERDALVVALYGECTYQQAAAWLRQPERTTRSRIRSALHRLAGELADEASG